MEKTIIFLMIPQNCFELQGKAASFIADMAEKALIRRFFRYYVAKEEKTW
ncbi:MAG: hypothetical protein WC900_10605 [Oscillospiraceae bacterium]|jgi:hypothetical protein